MTTCSYRTFTVLVLGALLLAAGCTAGGNRVLERPRLLWGSVEHDKPDPEDSEPVRTTWAGKSGGDKQGQTYWAGPVIAVLPVHNMTAGPAPVKKLEALMTEALEKQGVTVLDRKFLEDFMKKRRMRYTGGLDTVTAAAMKAGIGVEAALVSTLELFDGGDPPRIALHSRLVSTGSQPEIEWMESVCMAGDDAPGFLDLGVYEDPEEVMEVTTRRLAGSLIQQLAGSDHGPPGTNREKGISPTISFKSPVLESEDTVSTVAVMPFLNLSQRPYAWEILPLHFVKNLIGADQYSVMEPGVVRRGLLDSRVTVEGGLSKPNLELALRYTDADLVISGAVLRYLDGRSARTEPEVEFSVQVYDSQTRKIVWSSRSIGSGDKGIYFFDVGKRSTACKLADELVRETVKRIIEEREEKTEPLREGTGI